LGQKTNEKNFGSEKNLGLKKENRKKNFVSEKNGARAYILPGQISP